MPVCDDDSAVGKEEGLGRDYSVLHQHYEVPFSRMCLCVTASANYTGMFWPGPLIRSCQSIVPHTCFRTEQVLVHIYGVFPDQHLAGMVSKCHLGCSDMYKEFFRAPKDHTEIIALQRPERDTIQKDKD